MKRIYIIFLTILVAGITRAQIAYNFAAVGSAFTANTTPTVVHTAGIDDAISAAINIGFTFPYGCTGSYTQFKVTSNGVMFLGAAAVGSNVGNNLNTSTDRPAIAPLWDDLAVGTGGSVNYKVTGVAGSRVLTVEWLNMEWSYSATTPVISFQAKLYETTGIIEFIYRQEAGAIVVNGASIGISGPTSGDFYSLNGTGAAPVASKVTETTNLSTKPATGQLYRWTRQTCSGVPTAGSAVATPSFGCGAYNSTLTLSGSTAACGLTYQWQSGPSSTGPWTNIAGATTNTAAVAVSTTTYYRCILSCGASTAASTPATATVSTGGCGTLCNITSIPSLPYNVTGQTTCGMGNDVTSTNVTSICGSSSYYGGEDVVYSFTPTVTGQISINVTSTGSWMGAMLYQGCPVSGGTCVGSAQSSAGNQTLCPTVTAGQVYYLVLDSYPSPTCNPYGLSISGCTGAPTSGTAVANPALRCAAFTTTLSLTGASASCGLNYQWQTGPSSTGPWTNIAGATSSTATANVSVTGTYFRCVVGCSTFTSASVPAGTTITPSSMCGLCGVTPITLPYSSGNVTTCGSGDDLTAAMVTNACGSTSYLGGEDVIYTFTPTVTGQITITYSTSGSSAGAMLYQGCPNSGGTCAGSVTGISSFSGNQSFCPMVTAGQPYFLIIDSWPAPTCNGYNVAITSPSATVNACSLSTYTGAGTTYTFESFVGTNAPQTDDVLFNSVVNLGFNFCYGGSQYNTCYIASNGAIVFDAVTCFPNILTNTNAAPGIGTGWSITAAAPVNNTSIPRNAILGPWQDIDPSLGGLIEYATVGTAPNRRFIVSYDQIPMFSCGTAAGAGNYFSGQIKIFETSGNIEIHIRNKQLCTTWNGGYAVMGLHSADGTIYRPPTASMVNHNYPTQWTMTNTGYRWTSACANCAVLPVEFKNFYGERIEKVNKLYWETAVEKNIVSYSIERSADAENFVEIAKVNPKNQPSLYNYDDAETKPGSLNYYRIISVDKDGERKSTNVIPLGANLNEVVVSGIYPNPTNNEFNMSIDSRTNTELHIKIYDVVGKMVKSFNKPVPVGVQLMSFSVSDLPAGSYMMEVRSANGQVITQQKLVKVD